MKYKVEVQADNTGTWASNALTFDTAESAKDYALDLWSRWTLVRHWRVVDATNTKTRKDEEVEVFAQK